VRVNLYYHTRWSPLVESFSHGVARFGHDTTILDSDNRPTPDCDFAVAMGAGAPLKGLHEDLRNGGIPFLSITDGFLRRWRHWQDRRFGAGCEKTPEPYWGVARNGVHAYGEHVSFERPGPERWKALGIEPKPWRQKGDHIILAHQCHGYPWSYEREPNDRRVWYKHVVATLQRITDRPIVFKPHPKEEQDAHQLYGELCAIAPGRVVFRDWSLTELFHNAWALVTYDSNAAVEAVIGGIPVFTGGCTMAGPVANRDLLFIEHPRLLDRTQWFNWVAWTQWTEAEMEEGLPWQALVEDR